MSESETERPTGPPQIGWKMGVAGLVGLAVIGWQMVTADGSEPAEQQRPGVERFEAWGACKSAVEDQLMNPATADFSVLTAEDERRPDGGYNFSGALSAENALGVERDLVFSCKVTPGGDATATVGNAP